jgi:SMC interacting uncharacterized protein involved in chromosome segregation
MTTEADIRADIRDIRNDIRKLDERIYDQQTKTQEKLDTQQSSMQEKLSDLQNSITKVESILSTSLRHLEMQSEAHNKELSDIRTTLVKHEQDIQNTKLKADTACLQVLDRINTVYSELKEHTGDGLKHYRSPDEEGWFAYAKRRPYISVPATGGAVGTAGFLIYLFVEYILPLLVR